MKTNYIKRFSIFVVSIIANLFFILFHLNRIINAIKEMNKIKENIRSIKDVEKIQNSFIWVKDKPFDWKPWSITIFMEGLKDDCDGAAVLSKWLFKQIGKSSSHYRVYTSKNSHLTTITGDKKYLVSNHQLFWLNADWINDTFKYCYNQTGIKYTNIEKA